MATISRYRQLGLWLQRWRAFFPWQLIQRCLVCGGASGERICGDCRGYFGRAQQSCQVCAVPLAVDTLNEQLVCEQAVEQPALVCGECLQKPPAYDYAYSPYVYGPPLSQLINGFKYHGQQVAGRALGDNFCRSIEIYYQQQGLSLPDYITPVPLFWRRQWRRGFNQSALLAQALAQHLDRPYLNCARRIRDTGEQKSLSRQQRLYNLRHSFQVKRVFQGESLAIVDDVMTTGATVDTLAKALKDAGAGTVMVWALARTPNDYF